jgi:hypothetical protein
MKRIAAPMIGGLFTSFLMELLVYPAIYKLWRQHTMKHLHIEEGDEQPPSQSAQKRDRSSPLGTSVVAPLHRLRLE